MIVRMTKCLWVVWAMVILSGVVEAAPFARKIPFVQPNGDAIVLWGKGDEFRADFETLDGYTVIFDQPTHAYHYAKLSADGSALESTGVWVGKGDPVSLGLAKHLRADAQSVLKLARARQDKWKKDTQISQRWNALKTAQRNRDIALKSGNGILAPPSLPTLGTKVGLTMLIDFDDDPATIPQADVYQFCNGDAYTGYGNNGSVKQYYKDVSGGMLIYSNVVTVYIRIPNSLHPKSWYCDTTKDCGDQANLLIRDAVAIMKALPNYTSDILPTFNALTLEAGNQVVAFNVFYAGDNGGVWNFGLWPHSWNLELPLGVGVQWLSPTGPVLNKYQVTNIGDTLELGTFCHENGHMLCGYPDLYDYTYASIGGAGMFCLMGSGGDGGNPVQICAYLKRASGWAPATVEINPMSNLTAFVSTTGTNFNRFYRYQKPGVSTEYFLMENRQIADRDATLPGGGVAVWHVDELGDRDNPSLVPNPSHLNYELTLVQADNLWHFEHNQNDGDANDLYYSGNSSFGYVNMLGTNTAPDSSWWDGTPSRLTLSDFSGMAPTMTFKVIPPSRIVVTPAAVGVRFQGPVGGPFLPTNIVFNIVKQQAGDLDWQATSDQPWLGIAPTNGVLTDADPSRLVVVAPNSYAATLPFGFYSAIVTFSDLTYTTKVTRAVYLQVGTNYTLCSTSYAWTEPDSAIGLSFTGGVSSAIDLPFNISFYGQIYSNFHVTSHGLIGFGDPSNLASSVSSPLGITNQAFAVLAPLWSDIDVSLFPGVALLGLSGNAPDRQLIIRWTKARSLEEWTATNTFQVVIPEVTTLMDNDIIFQYQNVVQDDLTVGAGRTATIGIQNPSGHTLVEYSSGGDNLLADRMGMRFTMQSSVETNGPVPGVRFLGESGSNLTFEVRFDEIVADTLTPADFDVGGSLSNVTTVTPVSGNGVLYGLRYLVTVSEGEGGDYGSVSLTVRGGVVKDLKGNWNVASDPCIHVRAFRDTEFWDDMELGPYNWTTSGSNILSQIVLDVWKWGVPTWTNAPTNSFSGTHCWGTGMTGGCPDYAWAALQTPALPAGGNPVLKYAVWYNFYTNEMGSAGNGYVEVSDGTAWYNVTPNAAGTYSTNSGGRWLTEVVMLDPEQFGNRDLRVRFRVQTALASPVPQAGMFIDDVSLTSLKDAGVWVTSFTPSRNSAPSTNAVSFTAYNSSTDTLFGVSALVTSPDAGVTVTGRVSYGLMNPGAVVTGVAPVTVRLAAPGNFRVPVVALFHSATSTVGAVGQHSLAFYVTNVTASAGTNALWVKLSNGSSGVSDWLSRYLSGDGSAASCLFQVIAAGENGVIEPAGPGGQAGGDDQILYEQGGIKGYGRFGVGGVAVDMGRFVKAFGNTQLSGRKVYMRAWDAPSADAAVVYGNSALMAVSSAPVQTNAYVAWKATNIVNFARDSNGDGVPDGWCVLAGLDPRLGPVPLSAGWKTNNQATMVTGWPNRVAVWSNYVYVTQGADGLGPQAGKISIWSRDLGTCLATFGSQGSGTNQFNAPRGLAINASSNLLAVADTKNNRIVVLSISTNNGMLTWRGSFGTSFLSKPQGVAFDPNGWLWVADTGHSVIQLFDPNGNSWGWAGGYSLPQAIAIDSNFTFYVADTGNNLVQIRTNNLANLVAVLSGGVNYMPTDVQIGVGGRIYVSDQGYHRVQVFGPGTNFAYVASFGSYGTGDGQLSSPRGLWPAADDGLLYVADTFNNRVVRMRTFIDLDGDGMDDVWEDLHGFKSNDPSDALLDADSDGVTNLGEYRARTDPRRPDTNGNNASDLRDMLNGINPIVPVAPFGNQPPFLVSINCDVMGRPLAGRPVVYGESVNVTATFNKEMANAPLPNMGLNGGATLAGTPMVKTAPNVLILAYAVKSNDVGQVNAVITGAQDTTALPSDPPAISANGVFAVTSEVIRVSSMAQTPYQVQWSSISSFVYQVQSAPLLPTNNWNGVSTWTSTLSGVMTAPVDGLTTNREIFYRVHREKPPW